MTTPRLPAFLRGNPFESHSLFPLAYPAIDEAQAVAILGHLIDLMWASGGVRLRVSRDGCVVRAERLT